MTCFIGIDIGTTSTVGILIRAGGRGRSVLAKASRPSDLISDAPGWAEEEPAQWWATPAPWSAS